MSNEFPIARNIAEIQKINKERKIKLLFNLLFAKEQFLSNLSNKKIVILKLIKATTTPPIISVKKCAPTTILLRATRLANKIKKNLIFDRYKDSISATTKIVDVCPDGNE